MKFTFILGKMSGGGAERVIANLTNYLVNKRGDKVEIITLLNNKVDYELPKDVKLTYIDTTSKHNYLKPFYLIKELRRHFLKSNPDVILSFFVKINLLVLMASIGIKKPVYISERNDPRADNRSRVIKLMTYLLYPLSKGIVFQTSYAKSCFPKLVQNKSRIISNPVNININFEEKKKLSNSIVSVGKLMEQKNHFLLIDAFSLIVNKFPQYKLYIYGEGPLKGKLEKHIKEMNLSENVFLMGRVSEIYQAIYNADMFVLSSNYEGLSNALLEAMALNTPVISTNCAGSREVLTNTVNGRIVKVGDQVALANAIENNIISKNKAIEMASIARDEVKELSFEKTFYKWENFLKQ